MPSGKYSRIRSDHSTELAEDYVEAIAEVISQREECRAVDLAQRFEVSHVTVKRTLERLKRDGYIEVEPYGPVMLTARGRRLAKSSAERHATVLNFLLALGVSETTAMIDSEGIEHHVSAETLKAMREFADRASKQ